jgi:ABC-2 type transport system permease protein
MWAVFEKALYDARRTILWVSVGLAAFGLLVAGLYPSFADQADDLEEVYQSMPDEIVGLVGGNLDVSNPVVFINLEYVLWSVLIVGAVVMIQAFNAVTNAERNGTMDIMLAFPISRRDLLLGRYLNTLATILIILTSVFLTILVSSLLWSEIDIPIGDMLIMVYGALIILVPHATFTSALTTLIPSSKRWAGAIAYTLFFGMYIIHGIANGNPDLSQIQPFLLFDYYNGVEFARDGVELATIVVMAAITIVFAGLAWWRIDEKELGV